jgi:hypothetical protein
MGLRMIRWLHRPAMLPAIVILAGCTNSATTALLSVDSGSPATIASFYGHVTLASLPPREEQPLGGPLQLPGTLMVVLPDIAESVTISLRAVTSTGHMLAGAVAVTTIPYQQVTGSVTLTPAGAVQPSPGDGGAGGAADLSGPTPNADGGVIAGPDLAAPYDMAPVVLARDDFQRADQSLWGTASDGQAWGADANTSPAFSITSRTGTIAPTQTGYQTAVLGPTVADADVVVTGALSSFVTTGNNNELAAVLRWVDNNRFYKAGIDGNNFRLFVRTSASSSSTLTTISFAATAGTAYSIRFRAQGTSLMAKAWPASAAEPSAWMLTATDASIASGQCGLRLVFNNSAARASFTSFLAVKP